MMMGAVFTNMATEDLLDTVMYLVDRVTPPIFIMFFVLSGAELQFDVLLTVGGIGVIYILGRVAGKLFGAYLGAEIAHASPNVKKYLGFGLIPQAGVADWVIARSSKHCPRICQRNLCCYFICYIRL